jgi:hypothetical protein
MPRAPKRCLGTAPKFPCAVSELIQPNTDAERHELVVGASVLSHRAASLASSTPTRIVRAQWQLTDGPLCADIVAKVENRATRKISRKLIFGLLCRYVAFQRHYGGPRSILDETIWSLTSPRVKRIRGSKSFRSAPRKDFCNNIRQNRTSIFQPLLNASRREGLRPFGTIIREGARRRGCPVVVQGKHFNLPPLVFLGEDGITGVWRTIF